MMIFVFESVWIFPSFSYEQRPYDPSAMIPFRSLKISDASQKTR